MNDEKEGAPLLIPRRHAKTRLSPDDLTGVHDELLLRFAMRYEWDETKREANLAKHDVDFASALEFDWQTARVYEDARLGYGERRFRALGLIEGRIHALVFTRRESHVRIISLRKANQREARRYAEQRPGKGERHDR